MSISRAEQRRIRWRRIIFDHDTKAGNAFDVGLIIAILGSVVVVMLDSLSGLSGSCACCGCCAFSGSSG